MKQLNIALPDEVLAMAKQGAEDRGMLLRRWVEAAIRAYDSRVPPARQPAYIEYDPSKHTPQQALDAYRQHSNAVLQVGPESERQIVPIEETEWTVVDDGAEVWDLRRLSEEI